MWMNLYRKARGIVEMGVCWPAFGGERMIVMPLLEFEREFGCLCLILCVHLCMRLGGRA